jgi:aspartate aminotransferase-like enzyme
MPRQLLFLPGPVTVAPAVLEAAARPMINHRGEEFARLIERIVDRLRPVFGTRGEILLLGSSGTGGLEAVVANLFSPRELLLSAPLGAFGKRFAAIAERYGCVVETLETDIGAALDPGALASRLERDTQRKIAGVLLTQNETSTGVAIDMAALAPILRSHGAITLVDSVSGIGASEFRMDEWGYDAVVTASQKALAAPPGVAMVALSERAWNRAATSRLARFYFDFQTARESARRGQTPWTPPISILYALDVALQRYHADGIAAAYARHARFAQTIRSALRGLGFTLVSRDGAHSPTVVAAFPPEGVEPASLLKALRENHGIVMAGSQGELTGKIIRFGTMGDVSEDDVRAAIAAISLELRVTSGVA